MYLLESYLSVLPELTIECFLDGSTQLEKRGGPCVRQSVIILKKKKARMIKNTKAKIYSGTAL